MNILDENLVAVTPDGWELVAQQCKSCGHIAFPRKKVCPECFGDDLDRKVLSKTGILHTFARTYLGMPKIGLPYDIGFVDLPEKIRLFGLIKSDSDVPLEVGQSMDIVFSKLWQDESGDDVFCYAFQPQTGEV